MSDRIENPTSYIYLFLIATLLFGVFFLYATPPFQGADERNHISRAYAVSTGEFTPSVAGDRRGGYVPGTLIRLHNSFAYLCFDGSKKTTPDSIGQFSDQPLLEDELWFQDYPNTAVYPWPVYTPAAIGLALARVSDFSVLNTLRAARWAGLLAWLLAGSFAIWLLPAWRGLFTALLLLPMTVWTHATVSADTFTNCTAVLTIAYLLRLAYGKVDKIDMRRLAILLFATVVLASAKLVYTPILLLAILIPARRFHTFGGKWLAATLVGGVALATLFYWSHQSDLIYLPYADYNTDYRWRDIGLTTDANVRVHRDMIIKAPYRLFRATANGIMVTAGFYARAYIGVFGWLDTYMSTWIYQCSYLYLFSIAFTERTVRWTTRLVSALGVFTCFLLVSLSQLLSWEAVGAHSVNTAQGRYLVPFAPLLFLAFTGKYWSSRLREVLVALLSVMLLTAAAICVYKRYYIA